MTVFFTSDTHWGHKNIIRYSDRPFASVEDMDEEMIRRWNALVGKADIVYHLGDVGFMPANKLANILRRLNGTIHLNIGNHDSKEVLALDRWASVEHYREVSIDGQFMVLSHYSHRVWNKCHRGALMLYGHSHNSLSGNDQSLDVGVDCWDFAPVTLSQIKARLKTLPPYASGDHHVAR